MVDLRFSSIDTNGYTVFMIIFSLLKVSFLQQMDVQLLLVSQYLYKIKKKTLK